MTIQPDENFAQICRQITEAGKSEPEWAELESDDMFDLGSYRGGFDADENAFCFETMIDGVEHWFQVTLAEVQRVVHGEAVEIDASPPTDLEPLTCEEMLALLDSELERCTDHALAEVVRNGLVTPRLEQREWDYGEDGQRFPCWIVWEHPPSDTAIGHCLQGFGPYHAWGLLFVSPSSSLGMDCQWYRDLPAAVRESHAWDLGSPPGYEVE